MTRFALLCCVLAAACGDDNGGGSAPPPGADAGALPDFACDYPAGPYGTAVGDVLAPFALPACDNTLYGFVGADFCGAELTVLNFAAEWCAPCIEESRELNEQITRRFAARGVHVIQVLVATMDFGPADQALCSRWVERFSLENVELYDPTQSTNVYWPGDTLPSTLIIDRQGMIRFRENGAADGLTTLQTRLEALLAE